MMNSCSTFEINVGETVITSVPCRLPNGHKLFTIRQSGASNQRVISSIFYISYMLPYFFEGKLEGYSAILEAHSVALLSNSTFAMISADDRNDTYESWEQDIDDVFVAVEEYFLRKAMEFIQCDDSLFENWLLPAVEYVVEGFKIKGDFDMFLFLKNIVEPYGVEFTELFSTSHSLDESATSVLRHYHDFIFDKSIYPSRLSVQGDILKLGDPWTLSGSLVRSRIAIITDRLSPLYSTTCMLVTSILLRRTYHKTESTSSATDSEDGDVCLILAARFPRKLLHHPSQQQQHSASSRAGGSLNTSFLNSPDSVVVLGTDVLPDIIWDAWKSSLETLHRAFHFPEEFSFREDFHTCTWLTDEVYDSIFSNASTKATPVKAAIAQATAFSNGGDETKRPDQKGHASLVVTHSVGGETAAADTASEVRDKRGDKLHITNEELKSQKLQLEQSTKTGTTEHKPEKPQRLSEAGPAGAGGSTGVASTDAAAEVTEVTEVSYIPQPPAAPRKPSLSRPGRHWVGASGSVSTPAPAACPASSGVSAASEDADVGAAAGAKEGAETRECDLDNVLEARATSAEKK